LGSELIGDDECARRGFELRLGFQQADAPAPAGHARRRKQSGCGTADDDDFPFAPPLPELIFYVPHDFHLPQWRAFHAKSNRYGCHAEKFSCFPSGPGPLGE
jgi:hypothetical protein